VSGQPVGPILDGLDIKVELEEGELLEGAIVLLLTDLGGGEGRMRFIHSAISFTKRLGMLRYAQLIEERNVLEDNDE